MIGVVGPAMRRNDGGSRFCGLEIASLTAFARNASWAGWDYVLCVCSFYVVANRRVLFRRCGNLPCRVAAVNCNGGLRGVGDLWEIVILTYSHTNVKCHSDARSAEESLAVSPVGMAFIASCFLGEGEILLPLARHQDDREPLGAPLAERYPRVWRCTDEVTLRFCRLEIAAVAGAPSQ